MRRDAIIKLLDAHYPRLQRTEKKDFSYVVWHLQGELTVWMSAFGGLSIDRMTYDEEALRKRSPKFHLNGRVAVHDSTLLGTNSHGDKQFADPLRAIREYLITVAE